MQRFTLRSAVWSVIGFSGACVAIAVLWSYIFSFQNVTVRYDASQGYVELINEDNQKLYPKNNQPLRLKKGEYHLQHIGDNIEPNFRKITIGDSTTRHDVTFTYTEKHLSTLLTRHRSAIHTAILKIYPNLTQNYTFAHERLYRQGDIYGAALVARDATGDNADTLRILVQKKGVAWRVVSTPPVPVLSTVDYPGISRKILVDINRAK